MLVYQLVMFRAYDVPDDVRERIEPQAVEPEPPAQSEAAPAPP